MHPHEKALFEAILSGDEDAAIGAIDDIYGFDSDEAKAPSLNAFDENGFSALQLAVRNNLINVVENLLITSADKKLTSNPEITLVDLAIEQNNLAMLELLLEYDAPIEHITKLREYLEAQDPENPIVQTCLDKVSVNVSYIWIGDSSTKTIETDSKAAVGSRARGVLGQDTLAPRLMSERTDPRYTHLMFWCLDQYLQDYREIFKNNHIQVLSIEHFLKECCQHPAFAEDAKKVLHVMEILLSPERNSRRDKTTIKNIVALFLLNINRTDYVMDTNVRPANDLELNLHKYNHFHAPCMYQEFGIDGVDVWTMYSPRNDGIIYDAFQLFYQGWEILEEYYNKHGDNEHYRKSHGHLVVSCLCMSERNIKNNLWMAEYLLEDRSLVVVKELGIRKYYDNTHKYVDRSEYESEDHLLRQLFRETLQEVESNIQTRGFFSTQVRDLIYDYVADTETKNIYKTSPEFPQPGDQFTPMFRAAMMGNVEKIDELVALGDNVNQLITRTDNDMEGYTPLHAAIEHKQLGAVEALLKNNALIDLPLKTGSKVYTAYEYIAHMIPENERQPYYNLFNKYAPPDPVVRIKI